MLHSTNVGNQKIDGTIFEIYGIMVAAFSVPDWINKVKFFQETVLVANVSLDVVHEIIFFILSDTDVDFSKEKL